MIHNVTELQMRKFYKPTNSFFLCLFMTRYTNCLYVDNIINSVEHEVFTVSVPKAIWDVILFGSGCSIWNQVYKNGQNGTQLTFYNVLQSAKASIQGKICGLMFAEGYRVTARHCFMYTEVCSCVVLAWCCEQAGSHLSTLCNEDGKLGLVVWSRGHILLGGRSTNLDQKT